ncbi:hypothetical protein B0H11DRAFT_1901294 [Mycena galericulata]|nr:hypothetical protein B0H11DRAFT_1901294 [Mycena galericulata]
MSPLNESSASFLTAALPTSTTAKIILIILTLVCMAYIIRVISPAHLTRVLVSSLAAAEHALLHAIESGTFRSEYAALAERLTSLQLDVSLLREASLCDSLSYWAPFSQFFKFRRALAILRCIQEVRALETDIEWRRLSEVDSKILKEFQLRKLPLETSTAAAARAISMRRRLQI